MKLENRFSVPVPRAQALAVLLDVERIAPCMPGAALTSREGDNFTGTVKVKVGPINLTYGGQAKFVSIDEQAGVVVIEGSGKETRGTGTAKALVTCRLVDKGDSTEVEVDTDLNVTGKPASFGRGVLADVSGKLVDQFAACLSEEILAGTPTAEMGAAGPPKAGAAAAGTPTAPAEGGPIASAADKPGAAGAAGAAGTAAVVGAAGAAAASGPATAAAAATAADVAAASQPISQPASTAPVRPVREVEPIDLLGTAGTPVLKRLAPVLAGLVALLVLVRRLRR